MSKQTKPVCYQCREVLETVTRPRNGVLTKFCKKCGAPVTEPRRPFPNLELK